MSTLREKIQRGLIGAWVFALVLALWPLTANPVEPIKELLTAVFVTLLAFTWLIPGQAPETAAPRRRPLLLWLVGVWLAWSLVCALLSDYPFAGLDELRVWLAWFLMAVFASRVYRNAAQVRWLFLAICIAIAVSSLYGFVQHFGLDPFPWVRRDIEEYRGLPSTYGNPNFAGHTLILGIILACGLALRPRMWWVLAPAGLMAAHLMITRMRGGPLGLMAAAGLCLTVWWLMRRPGEPLSKGLRALSLVGAAGMLAALLLMPISYVRTGFYIPTDSSLILRYNGYHGAARMLLDHPVFGVGPGNYHRHNIPYWTTYEERWFASTQKRNLHVHSDILETGVEAGLPGMALHIALIVALLLRSLVLGFSAADSERRQQAFAIAACFLAFTVDGLFGFNLRVPVSAGLFFLLAGVLEGLSVPPSPAPETVPPPTPAKSGKKGQGAPAGKAVPVAARPLLPAYDVALFSLLAAVPCLLGAAWVFAGESLHQRAQGARIFAERAQSPQLQAQALEDGARIARRAGRFLFWEARSYELQGNIALRRGQAAEAAAFFHEALERDPYHPNLYAQAARAVLSHAVQTARDSPDRVQQVDVLFAQARRLAETGEQWCPPSTHVQDMLWRIARAEGVLAEQRNLDPRPHYENAERHILRSLGAGTQDVQGAYRALAFVYLKTDRHEEAVPLLRKAMPATPEFEMGWNQLESAVRQTGNPAPLMDALYESHAALRSEQPLRGELLAAVTRRLVRSYTEYRNDHAAAFALVQESLRLFPGRPDLWALLAGTAPENQRVRAVCEEIRRLPSNTAIPEYFRWVCDQSESDDALTRASTELARASFQADTPALVQDLAGAAAFLEEALNARSLPPQQRAKILANIATTYLEAGVWHKADSGFYEALAHLPKAAHGRLMAARARALAMLGRADEAMELAENAARVAAGDPMVQLTLARLLRDAGRIEEARFSFKSAIEALPENSAPQQQAREELRRMETPPPIPADNLEL